MSSSSGYAVRTPSAAAGRPSSIRWLPTGSDRLYLLCRDPRCVFAAWEITPATHERAVASAAVHGAGPAYRLEIQHRADASSAPQAVTACDLPDALAAEGWYFDVPARGGEGRARIGIVLPTGVETLLESRWIALPPEGPCRERGAWRVGSTSA